MSSSEALTRGVRVRVNCRYSPERSEPARREWFFLYTVKITNEGDETVELVNRHWIITNAHGPVQEVRGPASSGNSRGSGATKASSTPRAARSTPRSARCTERTTSSPSTAAEHFDVEIAPFALRQEGVFH